jgi:hypothetical protein
LARDCQWSTSASSSKPSRSLIDVTIASSIYVRGNAWNRGIALGFKATISMSYCARLPIRGHLFHLSRFVGSEGHILQSSVLVSSSTRAIDLESRQ